jgi:hypothetical protein
MALPFLWGLFIVINLASSPQYLWFKWPLIGWGIGLFFHAMSVFLSSHRRFREIKDKMIQEEIKKESL